MLLSISLGFAREGLLGAILFKAWVDILNDMLLVVQSYCQKSEIWISQIRTTTPSLAMAARKKCVAAKSFSEYPKPEAPPHVFSPSMDCSTLSPHDEEQNSKRKDGYDCKRFLQVCCSGNLR
jgi:hypothetical protein